MIFLDNASTTKPLKEVSESIFDIQQNNFYNPSATYLLARESKNLIKNAKELIAKSIGANHQNIIFTSCATEANNQIILSNVNANNSSEYLFTEGEHPSVYNVAKDILNKGKKVKFIPLLPDGKVDKEYLLKSVNQNTKFVSIICVSNETGAVNDIEKIVKEIRKINPKVFIHSDCVQAFSKININVKKWDIDAITISSHKINGPKGVGAIYVKDVNKLKPFIVGGGQENGLRSGTENVEAIVGFGVAVSKINLENQNKIYEYKKIICNYLLENLKDDIILVSDEFCVPNIISVIFKGIKGEVFQHFLDDNGVIVGRGSACSSKNSGNRVLESMKYDKNDIIANIRISLNPMNTEEEIMSAIKIIVDKYKELKGRMLL